MRLKTEKLAAAAILHCGFPLAERCCFACSQIGGDGRQVVTQVSANTGARDHDVASFAFICGHTAEFTPLHHRQA